MFAITSTLRVLKHSPRRLLIRNYTQYLKEHAYVNGAWVKANDGNTFKVENPATGEVLGQVADMGAAETEDAVQKAYDAFHIWRETPAKVNSFYLYMTHCHKTHHKSPEHFLRYRPKHTTNQ